MNPTPSDVHVNTPLTRMSVAFLQRAEHFIASRVFPNIPSMKQSDRYYTYDRGYFNRNEAKVRAPATESEGSGYTVDNTPSFFCDPIAFHKDIDAQLRANADAALNLDREAMELVMHKLLIRREVDFASNFFAGGVWTNDYDGVASSPGANQTIQWSDTTSGDPIGDIRAAKTTVLESTGYEPNTLVLGQHVVDSLVDHPDIVDRIKYSGGVGNGNPARASLTTLAQLFDIERILVSKAIQNTAAEKATNAHSFILGKKALLCYVPPSPGLMTPAAGYTFSWQGYLGTTNEFGVAISRFPMRHLKAERVEGEMAYDMKLVSADLGYFWDSIVA